MKGLKIRAEGKQQVESQDVRCLSNCYSLTLQKLQCMNMFQNHMLSHMLSHVILEHVHVEFLLG